MKLIQCKSTRPKAIGGGRVNTNCCPACDRAGIDKGDGHMKDCQNNIIKTRSEIKATR